MGRVNCLVQKRIVNAQWRFFLVRYKLRPCCDTAHRLFGSRCERCYHRPMLRDHSQHGPTTFEQETGGSYTRKEVCRLLKIEQRQLRSWERQQLIPELAQYRFSDLLALKKIARLRAENAHPRVIKQALHTRAGS